MLTTTPRARDARGRWVKDADPLSGRDIVVRSSRLRGALFVHENGRPVCMVDMLDTPARIVGRLARYLGDAS